MATKSNAVAKNASTTSAQSRRGFSLIFPESLSSTRAIRFLIFLIGVTVFINKLIASSRRKALHNNRKGAAPRSRKLYPSAIVSLFVFHKRLFKGKFKRKIFQKHQKTHRVREISTCLKLHLQISTRIIFFF